MKTPNIIVLCSDEHARKYAGCYGSAHIRTPAIDQLSQLGTTFDRAYTPSPICVPARASLATGLDVHETRCWSSAEPYYGQIESWMHRLRDRGHPVISFGKLHFRSGDEDNGFSEEIIPMHLTNNGRGWPQAMLRDPLPPFPEAEELAQGIGRGESDYTLYDRSIAEAACRWLRTYPQKIRDTGWALFVSFVSPHYPLTAPSPFYELYENHEFSLPRRFDEAESTNHPVIKKIRDFWDYDDYFDDQLRIEAQRCYYGLVSYLDHNIGQVLQALEDSGCADDTLVVYTSDHGEMLGHLGFWTKSVMYEGSAGIPLIATGPGFGRCRSDTPVSLTDIAPTIERAMSISNGSKENRRARALQDIAENPESNRFVVSQYHDGGTPVGYYMIRHRQWKYICYGGSNRPQLFNLQVDPLELKDYAQDRNYCKHLAQIHAKLLQVLDPELTESERNLEQAEKVAKLGGREAILNFKSFNHTPTP